MVKKVKLQVKAHLFDPKDPISITEILATFKLSFDTRIHEGGAMWVLPHYVNETSANHNSRMCATDNSSPIAASVRNADNRSCKLRRSYPEVTKYLLEKFATIRAITEFDAAFLRYIQPVT